MSTNIGSNPVKTIVLTVAIYVKGVVITLVSFTLGNLFLIASKPAIKADVPEFKAIEYLVPINFAHSFYENI